MDDSERVQKFDFGFADGDFVDLLQPSKAHPLQAAIMPVLLQVGDAFEVAGTAFAIGAELFLTAKHVLVDGRNLRSTDAWLLFVGGHNRDDSFKGGLVPIRRVAFQEETDLALLWVQFPIVDGAPVRHAALPIDFAPPVVNAPCAAIGYTAGVRLEERGLTGETLHIDPQLHASRGVVEAIHLERRDSSFLRFPVFRTSARFDHQMSGSPVLSGPAPGQHVVAGVVATAFDHEDPTAFTSYASLLWPAAALSLEFDDSDGTTRTLTLLDLAKRGQITAKGIEYLRPTAAGVDYVGAN